MKYYSTNKKSPIVDFKEAAITGQAPDKGLYFPERIPTVERDLIDNIEKLSNDWQHLSNAEILDIQLKEFEKWYVIALAHFQQNLIVIHGVGTGRLRDEIHDILRLKKEVKSFVNQYHPSFGYGATEIFFQY